MSKCGKGCMPECEYFTTVGCISPFNCIYKEESGYINSATSGTVIYTGGMNMPDEKMMAELKKKMIDALRGNIEYELRDYPIDNYTEVVFDYEAIADALLAANIGDVSEWKRRAEVAEQKATAWKDCANKWQKYYKEQAEARLAELKGGVH